jgi:farnesyl-diphosphate farnesyltransferase
MLLQQIEKFVETLFPSQKVEDAQRMVAGQVTEKDEETKKREKESWDDLKIMFAIMGAMVLVISLVLVRILATRRL